MKQYLRWKQVQQRLTEHHRATGQTYSFFEASRELWLEGAFQSAEELPTVSFEDWDLHDIDELARLMGETPVDLDTFYNDFRNGSSVQTSTQHIFNLDVSPIFIAADQSMGDHAHDAFEVLVVLRGQAQLVLSSGIRTLPCGSICVISPHFLHDALAMPGCCLLSIPLAEQTTETTLEKLMREENVLSDFFRSGLGGAHCGYLVFSHPRPQRILPVLRGILHECYAHEEYSKAVSANYMEIFFAQLLRCGTDYERYGESHSHQGATPMLAVLKHIQANYRTTSLQETAELFHYEPSYLGKQIKIYTGKNYTALIHELRVQQAKRLLAETQLPVEKVGEICGFGSLVHFSRSFKASVGIPPSVYRKQLVKLA